MIEGNTLKCPACDTDEFLFAIPGTSCTYIRCMRKGKDHKLKCGKEFVIPNASPEQLGEDTLRVALEEKKKKLHEKLQANGPAVLQKAKDEQTAEQVKRNSFFEMIEEQAKKAQAMIEEYKRTGNCMHCKKEKATTQSSIGGSMLCAKCKEKEDTEVVPVLNKKDPCDCDHHQTLEKAFPVMSEEEKRAMIEESDPKSASSKAELVRRLQEPESDKKFKFDVRDGIEEPDTFDVFITTIDPNDVDSDNVGKHTPGVGRVMAELGILAEQMECIFEGERNGKTNKDVIEFLKSKGWIYDDTLWVN